MPVTMRRCILALSLACPAFALSAMQTVDKFGFVSRDGRVIAPEYGRTGEFSEGLAAVAKQRDGLWGYIDKTGKMVIAEQFKSAGEFRRGFAMVTMPDGKSARIDKKGKPVKASEQGVPQGDALTDGPFPFKAADGKHGFMSEKSDIVILATFDDAGFFSEGLAAVKKDGKIGFIDATGRMAIAPQFYPSAGTDWLGDRLSHYPEFHGGLAPVALDSGRTLLGYINKSGAVAVKPAYGKAGYFFAGVAPVRKPAPDSLYAYIDTTGAAVTEFKYTSAWDFSEGTGTVEYLDPEHPKAPRPTALIDNEGNTILSVAGAHITQPMTEGVVTYRLGAEGLSGIMDKDGNVLVQPAYESLWELQDGMAKFRVNARVVSTQTFAGTHYVWYDISAGLRPRMNGGNSYYVYYAHVYGPKGLSETAIAEAVSPKGRHPVMNVPKGSGMFEYDAADIQKKHSSVIDEALRRVGVMHGAYATHQIGTYKAKDTDSIFGENLGTFAAKKP